MKKITWLMLKMNNCMKKITWLLLVFLIHQHAASQVQQPNIVLIITDQHSGKIMRQSGYPHLSTPGIDKIAASGVTFSRSYCTNPVCTSSRKSFMTGLMPDQIDDITKLPSIGGLFSNAGYETAYFGKWHVGSTEIDEYENWHKFETYIEGKNDTEIKNWSIDYLQKQHTQPFFMVTSFMNPHDCCELARNISDLDDNYHDGPVPEDMDTAYCPPLPFNFAIPPNEPEGFYGRRNQEPGDEYWRDHPTTWWTAEEWRQYMYGYDRLVEKVDKHIEAIYNTLESLSLLENTVIVYTADHGDGHGSHQWNQKKNFYEESVNIPFILSWKGNTQQGIVDTSNVVSNGLDMFPTLLGLAGITPPATPGMDLGPLILTNKQGPAAPERAFAVSEINQKIYTGRTPGTFTGRMLVTKNLKYMLFDKGVNREQLFDLAADPGELSPVTDLPEYAETLQECRDMLISWCEAINDPFDPEPIMREYDTNALLDSLYFNGLPVAGFEPGKYYYDVGEVESPGYIINAKPINSGAGIIVNAPEDIFGDSAQQVTRILVISKDGTRGEEYFMRIKGVNQETAFITELPGGIKVFPNPASGVLHIQNSNDLISHVEILNTAGTRLHMITINSNNGTVPLANLPEELYLLKITEASGRAYTTKFLHCN